MDEIENKCPVLYILVVGFHHKLGCQVEFSYPPLLNGSNSKKGECPSGWKYLSTLALPDGSHNFMEDTVFFNLPSLTDPSESVYGVSCYRQISVNKLKIRTADVTRSTVQKSVCCLTRVPIYAYIEVKLALIADAFFEQGDFSNTELLVRAYQELNASLQNDDTFLTLRRSMHHQQMHLQLPEHGQQKSINNNMSIWNNHGHYLYIGLWLRDIVLTWRHKLLQLLKLFILQKRTIFYGSPVRQMGVLILGISSLIPRLLERGFQEVACVRTSRPLSPMPDYTETLKAATKEEHQQHHLQEIKEMESETHFLSNQLSTTLSPKNCSLENLLIETTNVVPTNNFDTNCGSEKKPKVEENHIESKTVLNRIDSCEESTIFNTIADHTATHSSSSNNSINTKEVNLDSNSTNTLITLTTINPDDYRAPLSIFASGNLCLPYLSLPYMDLLTDPSVLSYVIGTSNVLFQQKRHLSDVLVDVENISLDIANADLKRQLVLTTEDLRFMDYILKHVQSPKEDGEGSELWIQKQFQGYLLALLKTTVTGVENESTASSNLETEASVAGIGDQQWPIMTLNNNYHNSNGNNKCLDHFNSYYIHAFRSTQCFQEWYDVRPKKEFFLQLPGGHPFASGSTLSVADMKLKLTQTMQSSESGRKLNQAVNTTSRAVGGAISHAKDAFSNWWSSITASSPISTNNSMSSPILTREIPENENYQQNKSNSINFNKEAADQKKPTTTSVSPIIKAQSNSDSLITTILNRQIELAKEVEEENLESVSSLCIEPEATEISGIQNIYKKGSDKYNNSTQTINSSTVEEKLANISKYESSDVYIV